MGKKRKKHKEITSEEASGCIYILEMFIVSILAGYYYKSWWILGGTLIGINILMILVTMSQVLTGFISIAIGVIWGALFYNWMGKYIESTAWKYGLTVLVFVIGMGIHQPILTSLSSHSDYKNINGH